MSWALRFCKDDKEMAEDLVQDTFVRMISSWETIRNLERPEKFLYAYLRYGFLRLRAGDRRKALHFISIDELDVLDRNILDLSAGISEWQQDIKIVVQFLCWRKTTAKSASLLLLRFFHGLFPNEMVQVARGTRKAVDDGLATARKAARKFVGDRPLNSEVATQYKTRSSSHLVPCDSVPMPSTEDFMRQMLAVIFAAKSGPCLSESALRDRYTASSNSAIDTWLLSHIVSCTWCFDLVIEIHGFPPRGTRPLEDVLGYAPKAERLRKKKAAGISPKTVLAETIESVRHPPAGVVA